jgi:beta-N-acetylhexosaminidase
MNLSLAPGKFLVVGFQGQKPESDFLKFIEKTQPCGCLLLGENYVDEKQLQLLISTLKSAAGDDLLIMADQEPGRVQRFKAGFPVSKPPKSYSRQSNPKEFQSWCEATAQKLATAGVNVNLAPIVDLWPFDNDYSVLNDRSFGDDAGKVTIFAMILIEAMRKHRVHACAKHFPGLGSARGDPHDALAVSDMKLTQFLEYHWAPFRAAVVGGVSFIMTTHIFCPALDSENCATFSGNIIGHLRYTVRHDGIIISDDLCMAGASRPVASAAVDAIAAGHNLVVISRDTAQQEAAARAISDRLENDESFRKSAIENEKLLERLKNAF